MRVKKSYEYIIVGTGFGGSFAAYNLAKAGKEVLLIDKGIWPTSDDSCWDEDILHIKDHLYRGKTPYIVDQQKGKFQDEWPDDTIGGMSTFYGAASFRLRECDFDGSPIDGSNNREKKNSWPYNYNDLEKYYDKAEQLICVAGEDDKDPTSPHRNGNYPHATTTELSNPARKVKKAANKLGLHPFHIPMAINFSGDCGKEKCILCPTCDHYLCKIEAKNDLTTNLIPKIIEMGGTVIDNTRVTKLNYDNGKIVSVDVINQESMQRGTIEAKKAVILGAGALSTPHLMLVSELDKVVPAGNLIGRNLMRHANGVVAGFFPYLTNRKNKFQKQMCVTDFYHGKKDGSGPKGPWGILQDISSIGKGVLKLNAPFGLKNIAALSSAFLINQLCIAEDIPQESNRVYIDKDDLDMFDMPKLKVYHREHKRDKEARNALYKEAKKILRKAGAIFFYSMAIETFSHALGTCKMGTDEKNSVVSPTGQVWGIDNLYITDASIFPSSGAVNPSLTIAANALKISENIINKRK